MKTIASCVLAAACSCAFAAEMEYATPESQGVDSLGILNWIDACEQTFDGEKEGCLHGFVIVRHGKIVAEGTWKPFDTLNEPHMLYSHSKSFTSSAVGFLVDEAKVDLDERVVDIFPEDLPESVSENLRALRVRDLLTMNAGKKDHLLRDGGNWVKEFLSKDFVVKPGTHFRYDSDATYMLSAIVEKRSGMKLMDFLRLKMFDKIGISRSAWSTTSPQGIACGGWGMNMPTRDIARLGQLYLQQGWWGGEMVLSPYWTVLATTKQTWCGSRNVSINALGEGGDWEQGYGFQFWRCRHWAFRADGASGQFTIVIPSADMVVSINAGLKSMSKELDLVWEHLLPAAKEGVLSEDEACARLRDRLANLEVPPVRGVGQGLDRFVGKTYEFKENRRRIRSVRLDEKGGGLVCTLSVPAGEQRIPVGVGEWKIGTMRFDTEAWEALGGYIGTHKTAASAAVGDGGSLRLRVYFVNDTGDIDVTIGADGKASGEFFAMCGTRLEGK